MPRLISYREKLSTKLGLPPKPSNPNVSKSMKGNKARDTKPELILRNTLWMNGLRGYRLHYRKVPGSPDICYIRTKLAIFVNGCFWHRCPYCNLRLPKSNVVFWRNKFKRNMERDRLKVKRLKSMGWKTLIVWECQLRRDPTKTAKKIAKLVLPSKRL